LTSSVSTSYSSAASCAMMGLGTRAGEEQLKEALRGNERLWTLRNAEQLEKLIADGSGYVLTLRFKGYDTRPCASVADLQIG
jgi:hypothetical protein